MSIKYQAEQILKNAYGQGARFREGQLEAIEATLANKRTLIVQKTGWGKSIIYFIATRVIRENGGGTTLIISPLLELMNNQIETASLFGLKCEVLNSTINQSAERERILDELQAGATDIFFTTPETLFREEVQSILPNVNLGLFVIDEAHCLSDWGHDFRREYSRLYNIIKMLPSSTPVLCTTATANNRVIEDLSEHLGEDIFVSRGDLMRQSLCLQVVPLQDKAKRYAWILEHINDLPGTGIIYCLTKLECDNLCNFLKQNGVAVEAYYSDSTRENNGLNASAITKFKHNKIKAIVATIKLGMGYDKPDIGFVIHYQRPQNIVAYYQQIGRAGRSIDKAYAILMTGPEDENILNYFIENAFPDEALCDKILAVANDKSQNEILSTINGRRNRIINALQFLEFDGYLRKSEGKYYRVPKVFRYNQEHYHAISEMRRQEMQQMYELTKTDECLLRYTVGCLNNPPGPACGRCANCVGRPLISQDYSMESLDNAQEYINSLILKIEPRLLWLNTNLTRWSRIPHPFQPGICLSKYGDAGYGAMVMHDKYRADEYRDVLLAKSIDILRRDVLENNIQLLTYVPSLRNDKVKIFAKKLAAALGLRFFEVIKKSEALPQKSMRNSSFQCQNALQSFSVPPNVSISANVILVDDIVDSRWTLAVCANLLGECGCDYVIPFCLADSSDGGLND